MIGAPRKQLFPWKMVKNIVSLTIIYFCPFLEEEIAAIQIRKVHSKVWAHIFRYIGPMKTRYFFRTELVNLSSCTRQHPLKTLPFFTAFNNSFVLRKLYHI